MITDFVDLINFKIHLYRFAPNHIWNNTLQKLKEKNISQLSHEYYIFFFTKIDWI